MTAPLLLAWIFAALLLQLIAGIGVALWRRQERGQPTNAPAAVSPKPSSGAWPGWRDFRVKQRTFEDPANSQCSFYLEPVDQAVLPSFKPGQFLTFQLPIDEAGETRNIVRCYSLSDRPTPTTYRVTIKRVPPPADQPGLPSGLSSTHFHDRIREGDILQVKAPSGHFYIDSDSQTPVVLIAGGIGITPMISMMRWCLDEQPGRTIHLYYGLRHSNEQAFKPLLEQLTQSAANFRLHVTCSRPGEHDVQGRDFQHTGHVNVELLQQTLPHGQHQFYVCGPTAMMESLIPALINWGVPRHDLHYEAFGPASIKLPHDPSSPIGHSPDTSFTIQFTRSGRTLEWNGQDENLLEFAERHGVAVDSGCRAGSCGSCETGLLSGEVGYPQPPDHDIAPGHCLLCTGKPASALTLDA